MARQCTICFKHLKKNCKCGSVDNIFPITWKFKVPKKGKVEDWKETLDFLYSFHSSRLGTDQLEAAVTRTRLQPHFKKLKEHQ